MARSVTAHVVGGEPRIIDDCTTVKCIKRALGVETGYVASALLYTMCPLDMKDQASYEKTFYTDAEAVPEPCTAKSTMYTVGMLAGLVAKTVKDLVTGGKYARTAQWAIGHNEFKAWGRAE